MSAMPVIRRLGIIVVKSILLWALHEHHRRFFIVNVRESAAMEFGSTPIKQVLSEKRQSLAPGDRIVDQASGFVCQVKPWSYSRLSGKSLHALLGKSQKEYVVNGGTVFALSGMNDAYTDNSDV